MEQLLGKVVKFLLVVPSITELSLPHLVEAIATALTQRNWAMRLFDDGSTKMAQLNFSNNKPKLITDFKRLAATPQLWSNSSSWQLDWKCLSRQSHSYSRWRPAKWSRWYSRQVRRRLWPVSGWRRNARMANSVTSFQDCQLADWPNWTWSCMITDVRSELSLELVADELMRRVAPVTSFGIYWRASCRTASTSPCTSYGWVSMDCGGLSSINGFINNFVCNFSDTPDAYLGCLINFELFRNVIGTFLAFLKLGLEVRWSPFADFAVLLLVTGVQLFTGLLAELLMRLRSQGRPIYRVREVIGENIK